MRKISFILSLAIFYIPLSFYGAELEKVEVNSLCYYINKETKTAEVTQGQYDKIKKMLDESNGTLDIPSVINVNEANITPLTDIVLRRYKKASTSSTKATERSERR